MLISIQEALVYNQDGWRYLPKQIIEQIMSADNEPFIATILALKEGFGKLERDIPRNYKRGCLSSFSNNVVGKEMFLGHISPEERSRVYRTPVAKIIGVLTRKINSSDIAANSGLNNNDLNKTGVFIKAYVSAAAKQLRQHIKEFMSNSVSIDADAIVSPKPDNTLDVEEFTKVYSVDFCNNGREGIDGAQVINWLEDIKTNTTNEGLKFLTELETAYIKSKGIVNLENDNADTEKNLIDKKIGIIVNKCKEQGLNEQLTTTVCLRMRNVGLADVETQVAAEIDLIKSMDIKTVKTVDDYLSDKLKTKRN